MGPLLHIDPGPFDVAKSRPDGDTHVRSPAILVTDMIRDHDERVLFALGGYAEITATSNAVIDDTDWAFRWTYHRQARHDGYLDERLIVIAPHG